MRLSRMKLAVLSVLALGTVASVASAQTALDGENLSALSAENLHKKRPKPPFDLTGDWNIVFDMRSTLYVQAPAKMTPKGQEIVDKVKQFAAEGKVWHEDSAACWPIGMPDMMVRAWPIEIIQLPTMVRITSMFNNESRWIYTDGRKHPPEDEEVLTYGGHSTGEWIGNELVVDTVGMTDVRHWVRPGIPTGRQFHIVEHFRVLDKGKTLEVEFHMTDPEYWEGDWVNTTRWTRGERTDIEEHLCIYEQMNQLPSFHDNVRN